MKELEEKIVQADSLEILEKVRVELFGKKGVLSSTVFQNERCTRTGKESIC